MAKHTIKEHILYAIDNSLSKGVISLFIWLFILFVIVITSVSLMVWFGGVAPEENIIDQILSFSLKAFRGGKLDEPWLLRLASFIIVLSGFLIAGSLISALTAGLTQKLTQLKEGHSEIIEIGHTVIIGWSSNLFEIISELQIANKNKGKCAISILGDKAKSEMEMEIKKRIDQTTNTRIICRSGDESSLTDLKKVNVDAAKSIIINLPDKRDHKLIATLLAIVNNPDRRREPYHIVTTAPDENSRDLAKMIGKDELEVVFSTNFLARIEAQTCRQSGLPYIYQELLDFSGDEIYFQIETVLAGNRFGDAQLAFETSSVIGLYSRRNGVRINPSADTIIGEGEHIIAISEDDDTIRLSGNPHPNFNEEDVSKDKVSEPVPERFLIFGWNKTTSVMLNNLDKYVPDFSSVNVLTRRTISDEDAINLKNSLGNLDLKLQTAEIDNRSFLEHIEFDEIDHIVIQSNDELMVEETDIETVSLLLNLRDIREKYGYNFTILSEILDDRNRALLDVSQADDFIVSSNIVSLALSQVSENKLLGEVFRYLFNPEGSEIYLKPVMDYVSIDGEIDFYKIIWASQNKGETAIGYRLQNKSAVPHQMLGKKEMTHGIVLNPLKSKTIPFEENDKVIVLAES